MKKKILITGANGLLGQKLVTLLLPNADVELLATSRGENKLAALYPQLPFVSLDVTNPDEVKSVIALHQPTHIIHTAAMTNVDECEVNQEACWKLNVDAVESLVKAAEENNVHFIHLSTDFIFDGLAGPYDEEAKANPISYYGESKLAAEQLVKQSSARWAIVRTVLVYGIVHDYGRSNIVLWVKNSLENQKPIKVVNDQFRTPTLAEDLALGCWLIADQDAEGVFNVSSKELITPYDMALQVADYFKLDASCITRADASSFTQTAKRPARTGFIITKAEEQLGFRPHTFTEGIAVVASQLPL
ncbi:SDR family oxidoreductase [Adhaeribacter pallidiroseus]|uniref:dTDP-4-dehydrorhamnose reductase n=1 Tax=Adhaeribacter pallidiroseus TaxID=2072847 RepID=A0A369QR26_9BACT|nr:SDR family oxidoreductase [Adhaeribacter pallidiroseus]RDC66125.1 dTDP-4-dehydrorhamnose reductase [Adhaeribacter pallidiroseus]